MAGAIEGWFQRMARMKLREVKARLASGGIAGLRKSSIVKADALFPEELELYQLMRKYGLQEMQSAGGAAAKGVGASWKLTPGLIDKASEEIADRVRLIYRDTEDGVRDSLKQIIQDAMKESPQPSPGELSRRIARQWMGPSSRTIPARGYASEGRAIQQESLFSYTRATTIARNEVANVRLAATAEAYADVGVEEVGWMTYGNDGRSGERKHYLMRGKSITVEGMKSNDPDKWFELPSGERTPYPKWWGLPAHESINCFPAGVQVTAPLGVEAGYRSRFVGDLVTVCLSRGHNLTGTPNHPVLTKKGWVGLGSLDETCDIVCCGFRYVGGVSIADVDYAPSPIEEVFSALSGLGGNRSAGADLYFHGDRRAGNVDIVFSNSQLMTAENTPSLQHGNHLKFSGTGSFFGKLQPLGPSPEIFQGSFPSSDSGMSGGRKASPFFHGGIGHPEEHGLRSASYSDSASRCPQGYAAPGDTESHRKRLAAFSSLISPKEEIPVNISPSVMSEYSMFSDRVVRKTSVGWDGHVFNLSTGGQWYTSNGIVVHNCRCSIRAIS